VADVDGGAGGANFALYLAKQFRYLVTRESILEILLNFPAFLKVLEPCFFIS
jgi:hypothetical protein